MYVADVRISGEEDGMMVAYFETCVGPVHAASRAAEQVDA